MPARPRVPRRHQREALTALADLWRDGGTRAWVVLPPGAGKTLVGLWSAAGLLTDDRVRRVVVLGPNTAIQGQWLEEAATLAAAGELPATVADDRSLEAGLTALTYQSLAVFDPDAEVDEDGAEQPLLARLHPNGRALVERLRAAGPLLLVLDECHHLLEVWGRLLAELLELLPQVRVLGLTATPPGALTAAEAELVDELFREVVYQASIPALVREGDLAPFAELAWLVRPTQTELDWLADGGVRFAELCSYLTDPAHGSTGFLEWLDHRFCAPVGTTTTWPALAAAEPELCDAALRMYTAGLLALPADARLRETHRRPPDADDWMLLADDWLRRGLDAEDPGDRAVLERVRAVLPSIGYRWTRTRIVPGRSPVDRVLARTEAKAAAAVQLLTAEAAQLGPRLRALVLCDHESASATLPGVLDEVLAPEAGSARAVLRTLLDDPGTALLSPLLVTGRTVAGAEETLRELAGYVEQRDPGLGLVVGEDEGLPVLTGGWDSRRWVACVTDFFEDGHSQVLIGTRGLLGEGWDARRVSGLVDLTAATTTTAVVQTRGRALRTDPGWPDKTAVTWSVVALAPEHPRGSNDWQRLVRKHTGFWGVDADGEVVDGVGHVDPAFSPYHPPEVTEIEAVNARMLRRAEERHRLAEQWRVGEPYRDELAHTLRLVPGRRPLGTGTWAVAVVPDEAGRLRARTVQLPGVVHPGAVAGVLLAVVA
ncbi:DEAD/DEAH box helicase family protein, partial [Desertihabitans aurantiacus]|uniref:DEAD/DEAH box helicase family protein n=1 Tax=Desertihabitans aurantiacus TaxID=2282477 RepID=UPI000DF755DD